MIMGLFFSLAAPAYLVFFAGLDIPISGILTAFGALAAVFGVIWIVEPLTYFPILGASSMYQAFMIGNISNKLLPAAMIAQSTIGVKAGTRKGELATIAAICGAATVHLLSLFIFVGLLGTWLVSVIPVDIVHTVQLYILPTVMGAVVVQAIVSQKAPRVGGDRPGGLADRGVRAGPADPRIRPLRHGRGGDFHRGARLAAARPLHAGRPGGRHGGDRAAGRPRVLGHGFGHGPARDIH